MKQVQREVAIMKKLVHPYLVKLFEVIDDAGKDALYLVLEYVPGGAVMEYCAEERRCVRPLFCSPLCWLACRVGRRHSPR